jgi:hypothetical protein
MMNLEEYQKLISIEIKKFIKKRIESRKIYKETTQIKNNIIYLKQKFNQENSEEFETENGKLLIKKYKSVFSSKLKKEFDELSTEDKRKLYNLGLLKIFFRLNLSKFEKLKKDNQKTQLDKFVIERKNLQPYYWTVELNQSVKDELIKFEEEIKEHFDLKSFDVRKDIEKELDEYEKEREEEENDEEEIWDNVSLNPSYFTDDDPEGLENSPENIEKGII